MKLNNTPYYDYKKDLYAEYIHGFVDLAEQSETIKTEMAPVYEPLKASTERLWNIFNRPNKSLVTKQMTKSDSQRDVFLTALERLIRSYLRSSNPEEAAAAETLLFGFESVGLKKYGSRISQTAQIEKLVNYLTILHPEAVETLHLEPLVEELLQMNDSFHELTTDRAEEFSPGAFDNARRLNQTDYKNFVEFYNAWCLLHKNTEIIQSRDLVEFNTKANEIIAYYNSFVVRVPSANKPDDATDDGGTVSVVKRHFITFMNGGRKVARFLCEVGKPIPENRSPAAPEGKRWDGIPELMPDEPVTVNAVPITQQPEDFTPEQLRAFPIYPALYGAVTEITNPNSLISPFNPLSVNYKFSNLLPGTPAPTEGEVPAGKAKVKFDREAEEAERKRLEREIEHLKERGLIQHDSGLLKDVEENVADTKPFCLWYDLGSSVQSQGFVPECLTGFHWDIQQMDYVLDTPHHTIRLVKDEDEDENEDQGGEQTLTPGMDWSLDVPAPEGWTIVKFVDKDGRETVKLYRNGSSVYTQGGYPENAPGYEWIGIHAILNGTTHTITEDVE